MEWKVYQRIAEQNGEPTVVSVDWQRVWRFSSKLTSHVILVDTMSEISDKTDKFL